MAEGMDARVQRVAEQALDWMLQRFEHQDTPLVAKELNEMMGALEKVQRIGGGGDRQMQVLSLVPRPHLPKQAEEDEV